MPIQLRIASASEASLAHCIAESAWRARRRLPSTWASGQLLLIKVADAITAIALVTGRMEDAPETSSLPGYVKKIPVNWIWTATVPGERVQLGDWAKRVLKDCWGAHYGFRILNQTPLPPDVSQQFLSSLFQVAPISLRNAMLEVMSVGLVRDEIPHEG